MNYQATADRIKELCDECLDHDIPWETFKKSCIQFIDMEDRLCKITWFIDGEKNND